MVDGEWRAEIATVIFDDLAMTVSSSYILVF